MSSSYTSNFKVRLDDLDYMGIVGNAQWLIFLERTRIELLEALGFPFADMQKKGVGGVVARAEVNYLRPARFGDVLSVQTTPKASGERSALPIGALRLWEGIHSRRNQHRFRRIGRTSGLDASRSEERVGKRLDS